MHRDKIREVLRNPLLVTYLLSGYEQRRDDLYLGGTVLPALGLHFPGTPEAATSARPAIYRLNRIAQYQLFEPDEGDDAVIEDTDDED